MSGRPGAARWWWATAPSPELAGVARALERGEDPPAARVLRSGARRAVWALPDVAGGLLVKRFAVRGGETLKYALLASRARSEYRAMQALVRLGLPVVRPLGHGERRDGPWLREAWFVGRLVPGARTLAEVLDAQATDPAAALELAARALEVVRELHAHPWLHRDLHAGNLLLDARGRMLVTDLHSMWRVPRLTRAMRLSNLARLFYSLRGALDLGRAPQLARAYAEARGEDADALVRDLQAALLRFERDYRRGREGRCLQDSSLFAATRAGGRLFHRRGYGPEALRVDAAAHAQALAAGGPQVLGRAPRGCVTRVGVAPGARVVKQYAGGPWAALRQALGAGRARRAWLGARRCEVLGLASPEALALLERPGGGALLVTRALDGARALRELWPELAGAAPARRGPLAEALGFLVGRLARAGLRHGDLSPKNVLVGGPPAPWPRDLRDRPAPGLPATWLIDLDALRSMPAFDEHGLVRMLTQLGDLPAPAARTDRLRFERGYRRAAGRSLPPQVAARAREGSRRRAQRRAARPGARPAR